MQTKKIVTIGGGSGGFTLLRGLRDYPIDITAIATVFDSGGSTGVLRDQYGALPQGDIRRCLLALLPEEQSDWRKLLMHRFDKTGGLNDHALGNLLLFAAEKEWGRLGGIRHLSKLLGARGCVLPVSIDNAHLVAELSDGTIVQTESAIDTRNVLDDDRSIKRVWLDKPATACHDAVDAILAADYIILGPGDLYTSIIPNLLAHGICDAINASHAKLIFVSNLMTKGAETRGYRVSDFVEALRKHGLNRTINYLIGPDREIPEEIIHVYGHDERAERVVLSDDCLKRLPKYLERYVRSSLVSESGLRGGLVRHSSRKLARTILSIIEGQHDLAIIADLDDTLCETTISCEGGVLAVQNLKLTLGAREFLETFPGKKVLLTAGSIAFQNQKMEHLGIVKFFDDFTCMPSPEKKHEAISSILKNEELNFTAARTIVLGDRIDAEIAAGNVASCITVRMKLPGGKYTNQAPSSSGEHAHYTVTSFEELVAIIPFL